MKTFFTSKSFLQYGGFIMAILGLLGFVGIIGPDSQKNIFGTNWYFDTPESWAYIVLGIIAIASSFFLNRQIQKYLVTTFGVVSMTTGFYGILVSSIFLGATLQSPADTILHFVIAGWAFYSAMQS